jgi:hypothetical protein
MLRGTANVPKKAIMWTMQRQQSYTVLMMLVKMDEVVSTISGINELEEKG